MDLRFVALRPVNLQFGPHPDAELADGYQPGSLPPDDELAFNWDRLEREQWPIGAALSECLWEYLELADGKPEDFHAFVAKWGVPYYGDVEDASPLDPSFTRVHTMRFYARDADRVLSLLIANEEERLVDLDTLLSFGIVTTAEEQVGFERFLTANAVDPTRTGLGQFTTDGFPHAEAFLGVDTQQARELAYERNLGRAGSPLPKRYHYGVAQSFHWYGHRLRERREGLALAFQRYVTGRELESWGGETQWSLSYDDEGRRRVIGVVTGAWDLVGAQLRELFEAEILDVYQCSVCGTKYPFVPTDYERRPRRDRRRFCSGECRAAALRERKRAYWHRRKGGEV